MDWNLWGSANLWGKFDQILWDFNKTALKLYQNSQKPIFKMNKVYDRDNMCKTLFISPLNVL